MMEKNSLQDLDLMDRFLFAEATEDPEILELMLEIIYLDEIDTNTLLICNAKKNRI